MAEPPNDVSTNDVSTREAKKALNWAAIGAVVAIVWIARPVGVGIFLGVLMAFIAQPLFERWKKKLGETWAAVATVGTSMAILVGSVGGLAWLVVARGTVLTRRLLDDVTVRSGDDALARIGELAAKVGLPQQEVQERVKAATEELAGQATGYAEAVASATGGMLLGLLFATLAMHFILRNWDSVTVKLQDALPLKREYTQELMVEFRRVGRTTLLGAIGTALAQGVIATIGYFIAGVPEPVLFGAATAIASFVPAVGTLLVFVPVGVIMILAGWTVGGIVAIAWGLVFVVGVCDYVIRPRMVRGEGNAPALVTFAALFGGVEVLGLKGLVIGPVVMALAIAILRLYSKENSKGRSTEIVVR